METLTMPSKRALSVNMTDEEWAGLDEALDNLMVAKGAALERIIIWFVHQPVEKQRALLDEANKIVRQHRDEPRNGKSGRR